MKLANYRITVLQRKPNLCLVTITCAFLLLVSIVWTKDVQQSSCTTQLDQQKSRITAVADSEGKLYKYDRNSPIIFIGGVPRSGTTLMRALLDAHPDVRCGEETRVIPRILQMRGAWKKSEKETMRLKEAGLTEKVIDSALSAFILEVAAGHAEPANILCNKDPFTLKSSQYLKQLFPNSKFIFMVRDGRATVHSIVSRKITITGFDISSYRDSLEKWNSAIKIMDDQCNSVGDDSCLRVQYEQLVLHPRSWLQKILNFVNLTWNDSVMHHEKLINQPNGISLSVAERSTDQVIKPINLEALTKWVGNLPEDVLEEIDEIAPMLKVLGYDTKKTFVSYGQPDPEVLQITNDLKKNENFWNGLKHDIFNNFSKIKET